jgi:hypothetical protein
MVERSRSKSKAKWLIPLVLLLFGSITGFIVVQFYSYLFAKTIQGEILRVEQVGPTETIVTSNASNIPKALFSFAIAIRDTKGEIHTGSTEDRQWAVAQPGQCAEAKFLPYPPWKLDRAGTFFGTRLIRLYECKPTAVPTPSPTPTPS